MTSTELSNELTIIRAKTDSYCIRMCVTTVCLAPILYQVGVFVASALHIPFRVNEDLILKGSGIGILSVIAFRFGSPLLQRFGLLPTNGDTNGK